MSENKNIETKEEFYQLLKAVQANISESNSDWSGNYFNNGFEDGYLWDDDLGLEICGHEVQQDSDGAGDKYQTFYYVYEFEIGEEKYYLEFSYMGSGSYFSDFDWSDFELVEVFKKEEMVLKTSYLRYE